MFLFITSNNTVKAQFSSGDVKVGLIVPGPAPKVGATIISPVDGTKITNKNTSEVSGTCEAGTFVVVKDNGSLVGSTSCTSAGIFILQIQLWSGNNTLSALNYDNLNQSGPETKSVNINVDVTQTTIIAQEAVVPILPSNPSIIDGTILESGSSKAECDSYDTGTIATGGEPHVSIVCVPRLFLPKVEQTLGILVWGGTPPYAVSVDLGDGSETNLLSVSNVGYIKENFSYSSSGSYKIGLKLKDKDKKSAIVQTTVQVSGDTSATTITTGTTISSIISNISDLSPFEISVPFYLLTVSITLGFWCGDIFERNFGNKSYSNRRRKAV